jgi:ATP-dependent exoDNAse (exonuclease V) alpha subunit
MNLTDEQKIAVAVIQEWAAGKGSPMMSLTGAAGTGKSTLISHIKQFLNGAQYTAFTGRAALRLSEVADVKATTLHSALYERPDILKGGKLEFNSLRVPGCKYLAIDESSMITPQIYEDLRQWCQFHRIRILFIGDSFQLPPILSEKERKQYDEFSIFAEVDGVKLTKIMRSGDGIIDAATIIRDKHTIPATNNSAYTFVRAVDPVDYAVDEYLKDPDDHVLITWRNSVRMRANHMIRSEYGYDNELPQEGEPITFCRNSVSQGILNGQVGIVKKIVPGPIVAGVITHRVLLDDKRYVLCSLEGGKDGFMDGNMPYIKNWKAYLQAIRKNNLGEIVPITYGYVSTAHKSQGNEYRRATIMLHKNDIKNTNFNADTTLPDGSIVPFGVRFLYTSITRAKQKAMLIIGE